MTDKDWLLMQSQLLRAAALATAAAEETTLEGIRKGTSAAMVALIDTDFVRLRIERNHHD